MLVAFDVVALSYLVAAHGAACETVQSLITENQQDEKRVVTLMSTLKL
jgi:hypothetical protein